MYRRTKKVFRATIIEGFGGLCFLLILAVTLPRMHDNQGQAPGQIQAGEFAPSTIENPQFMRTARTLMHDWFGVVQSHSVIESQAADDSAISKAELNWPAASPLQQSRLFSPPQYISPPQYNETAHAVINAYAVQPLPAAQIQVQPIPSNWQ